MGGQIAILYHFVLHAKIQILYLALFDLQIEIKIMSSINENNLNHLCCLCCLYFGDLSS